MWESALGKNATYLKYYYPTELFRTQNDVIVTGTHDIGGSDCNRNMFGVPSKLLSKKAKNVQDRGCFMQLGSLVDGGWSSTL